jgi:hypothetical protein
MVRVCKPGGCVAISNFSKPPPPMDPAWPMLLQQFAAYRVGVQTPHPLVYAPEELKALLSPFGFRSIEMLRETSDVVYASEEDWWTFLLTLLSRATIMGMDEATRSRFKDEYLANLRPLFRSDGLHLPLAIVYAVARR